VNSKVNCSAEESEVLTSDTPDTPDSNLCTQLNSQTADSTITSAINKCVLTERALLLTEEGAKCGLQTNFINHLTTEVKPMSTLNTTTPTTPNNLNNMNTKDLITHHKTLKSEFNEVNELLKLQIEAKAQLNSNRQILINECLKLQGDLDSIKEVLDNNKGIQEESDELTVYLNSLEDINLEDKIYDNEVLEENDEEDPYIKKLTEEPSQSDSNVRQPMTSKEVNALVSKMDNDCSLAEENVKNVKEVLERSEEQEKEIQKVADAGKDVIDAQQDVIDAQQDLIDTQKDAISSIRSGLTMAEFKANPSSVVNSLESALANSQDEDIPILPNKPDVFNHSAGLTAEECEDLLEEGYDSLFKEFTDALDRATVRDNNRIAKDSFDNMREFLKSNKEFTVARQTKILSYLEESGKLYPNYLKTIKDDISNLDAPF
jgi:hypothetical protein